MGMMRQITMGQLRKANASGIRAWVPFEIVSDGEVIAQTVAQATPCLAQTVPQPSVTPEPTIIYPGPRAPRVWPGTWRTIPPMAQPGDTFTSQSGRVVRVPTLDAEGNPMPE